MDVLRTGVSVLGCVQPEGDGHNDAGARAIADTLLASLGSMLLYWHHFARNGKRIEVETEDDSIAAHFLHLLHGSAPSAEWTRAMQVTLILYAEHEFNASTFTARVIAGTGSDLYSCITGAIGALEGAKAWRRERSGAGDSERYESPDAAEEDIRRRVAEREVIIGFGHPVYTISDPRSDMVKEVARGLAVESRRHAVVLDCRAHRNRDERSQAHVSQSRLVQGGCLSSDGDSNRPVYAAVCHRAHGRVVRACDRTAPGWQDHPAIGKLHRAGKLEVCSD